MATYEVYANINTLHKIKVCANSKSEAEELASELFDDSTRYETDSIEINGVVKVRR